MDVLQVLEKTWYAPTDFSTKVNMHSGSPQHGHRYEVLDGIRGIAAFCVMLEHYTQQSSCELFRNVSLAVDLFFVLSGFVIACSYRNRLSHGMAKADYFLRRIIRLWPMFIIGLGLGYISLILAIKYGAGGTYTYKSLQTGFALNFFFLPWLNNLEIANFGASTPIIGLIFPANDPLWSLFFEMIASIAFLVLYKIRPRNLAILILFFYGAFIADGVFLSVLRGHLGPDMGAGWGTDNFSSGFPRVMYGFSLGIFLCFLSERNWAVNTALMKKLSTCNSYILYAMVIVFLAVPSQMKGLYPMIGLLTFCPLIVYAGSRIHCKSRTELKLAQYLGWISYPVYCLHFPVFRIIYIYGRAANIEKWIIVLASVTVTMMLVILITRFYEEPLRSFLTGVLKKKQWRDALH